jgi:hypothetical protein
MGFQEILFSQIHHASIDYCKTFSLLAPLYSNLLKLQSFQIKEKGQNLDLVSHLS